MNRQLELLAGSSPEASYRGVAPDMYVPVLKLKRGEREALRTLSPEQRRRTVPLIEPLAESEARRASEIAETVARELRMAWPDLSCMVDPSLLAEDVAGALLDAWWDCRLPMVPVISGAAAPALADRMSRLGEDLKIGVSFRIHPRLNGAPEDSASAIEGLQRRLGLNKQNVDLVIDYGAIERETFLRISRHVRALFSILPDPMAWRSVILALSAFPPNLGGISPYEKGWIERLDWKLWSQLSNLKLPRPPAFGDYTIANPAPPVPGRQAPRNLRYTTEEDWLILKGDKPKKEILDSNYLALFEEFASSGDFVGEEMSWGDKYILTAFREKRLRGNASTWRQVGVSHHIAVVLRQIARKVV